MIVMRRLVYGTGSASSEPCGRWMELDLFIYLLLCRYLSIDSIA